MRIHVEFKSESSNAVFHYTKLDKLFRILKDNVIEMTSVLGSSSESDHAKDFYYLSTTRHRLGAYHLNTTKAGSVLVRLNSTKLRSNLKMKPVNYWGEARNERHRAEFNEAEDRFTSNKPQIQNAKKFMEDITVLFPKGITQYPRDRVVMRHIISLCKKAKIPIRVYYDKNDFLTDNESNAKPLSDFFVKDDNPRRKKSFVGTYTLAPYTQLIYVNEVASLSEGASELYTEHLIHGQRAKWEFIDKLKEDLNYARLTPRDQNPKLRAQLDGFTKALRRKQWTLPEYASHMLDKWSSK